MELSLTDAARLLDKTPRQVRYMIQQGKLTASKVGGRWRLQSEALPLSEAQLRARARKAQALRETVDQALGPSGRLAARRFSVRDLQVFAAGRQLWRAFTSTLGPDHDGTQALQSALLNIGRGCYRYHESDKREAFARAREHASDAVVLALLSGEEGVDALVDTLENDLLASVSGLIRRAERRSKG